jgi:release factor glutamine methyltransferase
VRVRDILRSERDVETIDLLGLLSSVLSLTTERLLIEPEQELQSHEEDHLRLLLKQRRKGRPMAYITGRKEFFSQSFVVDPRVLIPRPETELLVEEALRIISSAPEKPWRIADMGTGSGAVGITLARELGYPVTCLDISEDALRVAKMNAERLAPAQWIHLVCSDLFSGVGSGVQFDLITANLPYVAMDEWQSLMRDVRRFEPKLALMGGEDGLEIYRRLVLEVGEHLSGEGHILCEIGGAKQARVLSALLAQMGLSVQTITDLAGRDRVVVGLCKSS